MIRNVDKLNRKNKASYYINTSIRINITMVKRVTMNITIIKQLKGSTRRVRGRINISANIQNPNKHPSKHKQWPKLMLTSKKYNPPPTTIDLNCLNPKGSSHSMGNILKHRLKNLFNKLILM